MRIRITIGGMRKVTGSRVLPGSDVSSDLDFCDVLSSGLAPSDASAVSNCVWALASIAESLSLDWVFPWLLREVGEGFGLAIEAPVFT